MRTDQPCHPLVPLMQNYHIVLWAYLSHKKSYCMVGTRCVPPNVYPSANSKILPMGPYNSFDLLCRRYNETSTYYSHNFGTPYQRGNDIDRPDELQLNLKD